MKVKELIELLKTKDPELQVYYYNGSEGEYYETNNVDDVSLIEVDYPLSHPTGPSRYIYLAGTESINYIKSSQDQKVINICEAGISIQ
jgi:hypothetical protein